MSFDDKHIYIIGHEKNCVYLSIPGIIHDRDTGIKMNQVNIEELMNEHGATYTHTAPAKLYTSATGLEFVVIDWSKVYQEDI